MIKREMGLMVIAVIVCCFIMLKYIKNTKYLILTIAAILPAIYISINRVGQFMTADEGKYVYRFIDLSLLPEILQSAVMYSYRVMVTIIGTVFLIIPSSIKNNMTSQNLVSYAKLVHWLICFSIILSIYVVIVKYLLNKKEKALSISLYTVLYFYSLLLLPVNTLGLKVFNYDSLSCFLGVLSVVLVISSIMTNSMKLSIMSLIIALLATMEKLMAAPILYLSMTVYVYISISKRQEACSKILRTADVLKYAWISIGKAFLIVTAIGYVQFKYMSIVLLNGEGESLLGLALCCILFIPL